jgi:PAB-dependent poly(A)-specific ribonuclease subunit 2
VRLGTTSRMVFSANLSGQISILDPRTGFKTASKVVPVQAHTGGLSGADAQGNIACTWGWTHMCISLHHHTCQKLTSLQVRSPPSRSPSPPVRHSYPPSPPSHIVPVRSNILPPSSDIPFQPPQILSTRYVAGH